MIHVVLEMVHPVSHIGKVPFPGKVLPSQDMGRQDLYRALVCLQKNSILILIDHFPLDDGSVLQKENSDILCQPKGGAAQE